MACASCAERRKEIARAMDALRRGDVEAVKRSVSSVGRSSAQDLGGLARAAQNRLAILAKLRRSR